MGPPFLILLFSSIELRCSFSVPDVVLVVKLLFFSSIVVGEYEESFDTGEITVFLGFDCCGRVFPFCLFGVIGNLLDEREGTK
jgi:hypothetical protein